MKHLLFRSILICAAIGLNMEPAAGQASQISVAPDIGKFIVRSVIYRAGENESLKREFFTYKRVYTVDNLNDNEQVADRKKEEVVLVDFGGQERLVEKNGKAVNGGKISRPKFDLIKILEAMEKLDDFNVTGIEMLDNRPHYVIGFKPRPGQKTSGEVEDVIVRSEGVIYVDIEKFYIKYVSAWLVRPYRRAGIFGINLFSLTRANIDMVQEEIGDIVVMKSINIVDRYSFFGDTFEKQVYLYHDYQRKQ